MDLKILLPYKVFLSIHDVNRLVVDTTMGSYGFLPNRLDCSVILVPGILSYQSTSQDIQYVAIDGGILTKTGNKVQVSVRNAIGGTDLGKLRMAIETEFKALDEMERNVRSAVAKLESEFIQGLKRLRQE
jgi:F-type H+-transporting ATPase subunit epsilon